MLKGRTIRGIVEGDSVLGSFIPQLIEHFVAGQFPFDHLISFYPFDQINEAISDMEKGEAIKPVIRMVP